MDLSLWIAKHYHSQAIMRVNVIWIVGLHLTATSPERTTGKLNLTRNPPGIATVERQLHLVAAAFQMLGHAWSGCSCVLGSWLANQAPKVWTLPDCHRRTWCNIRAHLTHGYCECSGVIWSWRKEKGAGDRQLMVFHLFMLFIWLDLLKTCENQSSLEIAWNCHNDLTMGTFVLHDLKPHPTSRIETVLFLRKILMVVTIVQDFLCCRSTPLSCRNLNVFFAIIAPVKIRHGRTTQTWAAQVSSLFHIVGAFERLLLSHPSRGSQPNMFGSASEKKNENAARFWQFSLWPAILRITNAGHRLSSFEWALVVQTVWRKDEPFFFFRFQYSLAGNGKFWCIL